MQRLRISCFVKSKRGLTTVFHQRRWWELIFCILRNHLIPQPRIIFSRLDSILSVRLCQRNRTSSSFSSIFFWKTAYLRFLKFSSVGSVFSCLLMISNCHQWKNFPSCWASYSLSDLTAWLQCKKYKKSEFRPFLAKKLTKR